MKYIIMILAALVTTTVASAQNQPRPDSKSMSPLEGRMEIKTEIKSKLSELREAMKDRRDEIKAKIASSTEEVKVKFDSIRKERIKQRIENVSGKFDSAVARIEAFDVKVEEALSRFTERGVDVASTEALLKAARDLFEGVKDDAAAFDEKAEVIVESDEVSRIALKQEAQVVIQGIKDIHAAYVNVVASLKASEGLRANATSTATTAGN